MDRHIDEGINMQVATVEAEPVEGDVETRTVTGLVLEVAAGIVRVRIEERDVAARKAVSCLIEPEPGDLVLVAGDGRERNHVVAVLEREAAGPARFVVDGDLAVQVRSGAFSVSAGDGIDLVTAGDVRVTGNGLDLRAERGRVFLGELSLLGGRILAQVEKIKLVAGIFDSALERLSQRVKRSYRVVEELDHLRSGQISYRAEKNFDLRARNALVTAEELVKLDGDQIHLG